MLARLKAIPGLSEAAVSHSGDLLRLVASHADALDAVRRELSALGYATEPIKGLAASDLRWYAFDDVRDLTREEAEIIARRVTSVFARPRRLSDPRAIRLEHAVTDALYQCLAANELTAETAAGTLTSVCVDSAERAARAIVGDDGAREYASLLAKDLSVPGEERG